jgi:class 3 adenylate cyclase/predicted ATPase
MHCASCGIETRAGAKFCEHCGAGLPRACPECGVEVGVAALFCDGCGVELPASPDADSTQPASSADTSAPSVRQSDPAPTAVEPELRQATILFCDLAGSTALSTSLDPEDLRDVLRRYQAAAVSVINQHEGFVSAYLGDGILVQFGYPRAHEDDPERAIRAGLEVATAVRGLHIRPGLPLDVRIGIATGLTVVGDLIGEGASREAAVAGQTPNLAARLQSLAHPGEVIISDTTKRLAGALFELVDLGKQNLKGFDKPVPAWRVETERPVENRFEASHAGSELGPLVDREVEYPALLEAWRLASSGKGQVVTLRGEPGLGKSRLSEALRQTVAAQAHLVLRYFCSPRFQNTALYPVMRWMQHAADLADGDTDKMKLDKLGALLLRTTASSELASTLPYIAALLSIPTGERYPPIVDSPERQREQTLRALEAQILNLARDHPVLLIFEDLHWVDPTTLSSIDQLVRKIAQTPVMVLVTGRPEFAPPWTELPHSLTVELSRLERNDRTSIVQHHAGGKALPPEMLEHILQKSDGIPLFVEELTKAMMESGLLQEQADSYALTGPMPTHAVPSTLHDSLLARLDRLSMVKEVAQVGAAIGREFSYDMLATLLPLTPKELQATLSRLVDADLIYGHGTPPDAVYTFKHALIQDAAYATMLRARRQKLHAGIANILEADATTAKLEPELLAHHLTDAGMPAKAIPHWQQAGLLASERAAHTEACGHFTEGLRLLSELPDDATRNGLELGLRVHLGVSLSATRGYAHPEVEATYQRARELCRLIGDTPELYAVLRGLFTFYIVRADVKAAQELAEQCVRLGEETQRADFLIEGYTALGYALVHAGELASGRDVLAKAVDIYRTRDGARLAYPTPQDPAVACLSLLAAVSWILGQSRRAVECAADALQTAEELKRPFDAAYAHCYAAMFENLRHNAERAAYHAGMAIEISQRHGFTAWLGAGTLQLAIAKGGLGQAQEGVGLLSGTLAAWQAAGAELNSCFFLAGLAENYRLVGDLDGALDAVARAIDHATRHGEHFYDAALYRLRGEFLAMRDGAAAQTQAEADFQRAIEIAQEQGAKMFELRGRASLHALHLKTGQAECSRPALETLCSELARDGAESTDLKEAQALLKPSGRTRN